MGNTSTPARPTTGNRPTLRPKTADQGQERETPARVRKLLARQGNGTRPPDTSGRSDRQDSGPTTTHSVSERASGTNAAELILAVQQQMAAQRGFAGAATATCMTMAAQLKARRVSIGWIDPELCRVEVSSRGAAKLLPDVDSAAISEAMQEAVNQQQLISSANPAGLQAIAVAAKRLARMQPGGQGLTITVPLAFDRQTVGALCIEFETKRAAAATKMLDQLSLLAQAVVPVCTRMLMLERELALPFYKRTLRSDRSKASPYRRWAWGAATAGLLLVLMVPMQMQISSDARIEGAIQRAVVAPADGYLRSVAVRPGDEVFTNQILATLGERELELQRDRLIGQASQFDADASTAIANGDRASMAVARAKSRQASAELSLIEKQLEQTRVRAPFSGVVIDGDLQQSIGAPVDRGQSLFTIAPADSWRVIVEIGERDIMEISEGQSGVLYLSSLPWQKIPVVVERITPAATIIDGNNVFEVHAAIVEPPNSLRPGLRGTVRLAGGINNLASRLFGRIGDAIGRLFWRWQPW